MKIRNAKPKDIKYFMDDRISEFQQTFPELKINRKEQEKRFRKILGNERGFVLEIDKIPAGIICIYANGQLGGISFIAVKKGYRRKGYGTILIKKAEEYLNKKNVKIKLLNVTFNNHAAFKLYKKMGYKPFRYIMKKVKK